jgi:biotin synthase
MSLWEKFAAKSDQRALLICSSTHHLLLAEKVLDSYGIKTRVVPVPKGLVTHCSSGLEFASSQERQVRVIIKEHEISHEGIHVLA